jgi:hypothetical protein
VSDFDSVDHGKIVVIEKLGDEEGFGAGSLKRLVVEKPRFFKRDEFGEEIDWEEPAVLTLRSHNLQISPWHLDPADRYRIRGVFLRSLSFNQVQRVDADLLQRKCR